MTEQMSWPEIVEIMRPIEDGKEQSKEIEIVDQNRSDLWQQIFYALIMSGFGNVHSEIVIRDENALVVFSRA